MPTATKPATVMTPSAQGILIRARHRVDELESLAFEIDTKLKDCESDQVTKLMDARRGYDDERAWLMGRLAQYEADANSEKWQAAREGLNTEWKTLAERRVTATERLGVATRELVAAIEAVNSVHTEQRNLLLANTHIDKWKP
jgi:hypothetical protein